MKKVLERSDSKTNNKFWEILQLLYAVYRTGEKSKKKIIRNLIESVEKNNFSDNKELIEEDNKDNQQDNKDNQQDDINIFDNTKNTNNENKNNTDADDMMKDITESLKKSFVDNNENGQKINPIENIIKISQTIGEKYKNKIEKGDLTLNDMMGSLQNIMKNMDITDDEKLNNLSESDFKSDPLINQLMSKGVGNMVNDLKNGNLDSIRRIMKEVNPEKILGSMPGLSGLSGKLGSILGKNEKEKDAKDFKDVPLTEEQLKELEEFYQKIETVKNNENQEINNNVEILD